MPIYKKTPLHSIHIELGAFMGNFAGWSMPLHYGSQIIEHHHVRNEVGVFDISHMGIIDIIGENAFLFLQYLLANNIGKLKTSGKALYSCILNEEGGIIDDLIVYYINPTYYRLIVNAGTTDKDLIWIQTKSQPFSVEVKHRRDLAILAVQGPDTEAKIATLFPEYATRLNALKPFQFFIEENLPIVFIARTGYTGEAGIEIIATRKTIIAYWQKFIRAGIPPIGLAARDTLRLEAGYNLWGQDMDETVSPIEANLEWTVALTPVDREFMGRRALENKIPTKQLVGVLLLSKGMLRHDQKIFKEDQYVGKITSGSFSPTLKQSIALARIEVMDINSQEILQVEIRNQRLDAKIVQLPFVRRRIS